MKITVIEGPDSGAERSLESPGTYLIGRSADCELRLSDPETSRRHAAITLAPGRAIVDDQTSRNGTRVNEIRVQHAMLKDGDVIRLGGTHIQVDGLADAAPAPETTLRIADPSMRVLTSLNHRDADLVAGSRVAGPDADRENTMLRGVGEVSNILVSSVARQPLLRQVLDRMKALLDADSACVMLWDSDNDEWSFHAVSSSRHEGSPTVSVSRTIINQAVKDGMALLTDNPMADDRFDPSESIVRQKISSALCAPMTIEDELTGVICIDRRNRRDAFTPIDLRFTATVANILGVYLEKLRIQDDYIKQERLAAVGQVIAGLAHYAKNIITGLQLSVGAIQRMLKRETYDTMDTCVQAIATEEQRLTNLILDMLSYAKDREPLRMEMNINDVIAAVVRPFIQALCHQSIRLEQHLEPELPSLMAEKNALHRVVLNLFVNAMDALRDNQGRDKRICITTALSEDQTHIEITMWDSGCGVPKNETENIFGVFFSTKGSKGTGLGLAVSRKIIEEHGGTIDVESAEGEWTEFRISLPIELTG
ncbi:MAG: FHA domain-containing protein [Verrucomicrobia bacterium]|jgi:signal transduction histidine kinase|nr:FHA domain-containing protein [Verrucomicrobiota bacterium]MBT7065737.1 FHA domain-containing protein [Verrucomicrobiota bacterium]MBT7699480.1 FHA domain-containing protein [Verrucomicrobiota bacterium]